MAQVTPVINKSFAVSTIGLNGTTTLSFVITNTIPLPGVSFTDTLPAGLVVATPNGLNTTCPGAVVTATAGSNTISLAPLPLQSIFGCVINVNVTGTALGAKTNTVTVADIREGVGNTSRADINVIPPPTVAKAFAAANVGLGGTTALTFTVTNPSTILVGGIGFSDTLPAGLVVSNPNGLTGSCGGGVITATAGSGAVTLAGAVLAAGASCTFSVNVTATTLGTKTNVTGPVSSTDPATLGLASPPAVLTVIAPPTLTKLFGAPSININGTTSLTFTLGNPNPAIALTGVAFTDTLPAGMVIDGGTATNCAGGVITAPTGGNTISFTGGTLAGGATCNITVNIFGIANGTQINTSSTVTSTNGGTGPAATATLVINPIIDPTEAFQVRYISNLPVGDSVINLTNTGPLTLPTGLTTTGNICVNVYTFDASEELISCCSCLVTPNGLNSLSARSDLISNTLTPGVPTSIVVKLVASRPLGLSPAGTGGSCNASSPTPLTVTRGMRAWGTTIHALPSVPVGYGVTESPFEPAQLSVAELTKMTTFCGFIQAIGSGYGICKSCRTGGLGGTSK